MSDQIFNIINMCLLGKYYYTVSRVFNPDNNRTHYRAVRYDPKTNEVLEIFEHADGLEELLLLIQDVLIDRMEEESLLTFNQMTTEWNNT